MPKFLIDENLSPKLAQFLRTLGYKSSAVRELNLTGKKDRQIIKFAKEQSFTVITADRGFGEVFHLNTLGQASFIILRSPKHSVESFRQILERLHKKGVLKEDLERTLVIATHTRIRRKKSS